MTSRLVARLATSAVLLGLTACAPRHDEQAHGAWVPEPGSDSVLVSAPDSTVAESLYNPVTR